MHKNLSRLLFYLQIPGLIFNLYFPKLPTIHLFDIQIAILSLLFVIGKDYQYQKYKSYYNFIFVSIFSLIVSQNFPVVSVLYLIRLVIYILFIVFLCQFVSKNKQYRKTLLSSLLIVGLITALLGFTQYLLFPDLR